jgi:hypothetical protein
MNFADRANVLKRVVAELPAAAKGQVFLSLLTDVMRATHDPMPWYWLAKYCRCHSESELWLGVLSTAMACDHQSSEAIYHRGSAKLLLDDWSGWLDREARHYKPSYSTRRSKRVRELIWRSRAWDGVEDISDKTLVVIDEEGLGDTIQMQRFISALTERVGRLAVRLPPPLVALFRCNFDRIADVVTHRECASMAFDRYAWSMALPALMNALPPFLPLGAPEPARRSQARKRIGICWAGRPTYYDDGNRSLPLTTLRDIISAQQVHWVSLQVGDRAAELIDLPAVRAADPPLGSFSDTANVVSGLDAVVTCDTSVAHLAGSLGVPTFLLLQRCAVPRWGLHDTTPWYPTVRLIRQCRQGDWSTVVSTLHSRLSGLIAEPALTIS